MQLLEEKNAADLRQHHVSYQYVDRPPGSGYSL